VERKQVTIDGVVHGPEVLGPRPHYLESATAREEGDRIYLDGIVHFDSNDPTIADRAEGSFPHVNVTHAEYGVWNAIRVAVYATRGRYGNFSLGKTGSKPRERIMPNERVQLELRIEEKRKLSDGRVYGTYKAKYKRDDTVLMELSGNGIMF
jgi:hypothetical protein